MRDNGVRRAAAQAIEHAGVVAVVRLTDARTLSAVADALVAGGLLAIEVTMTVLGPGFLKDVRGPLPDVKLLPTGGVTPENAGDWIRGGAVAVGVGSALVDPAAVAAGQFEVLTANARRIVSSMEQARRPPQS
jgi:2-dehydro-3-deoxyphosphogluconate aldolase/(4S)-4-hydroxy-2-oxoglutarate aldolase